MLDPTFDPVVHAARAGGAWAWERLYKDLAPPLLGYLRMRGAADPEDVLGEVFVQIVRGLSSFEGDEKDFRSWVFTIAHRRAIDEARRARRRPHQPADIHSLSDLASPAGNVEDEALASLGTGTIRRLVARLTPDQQDVLLLRILGDLTIDEIARALDKRPGAVKALQRRALAALGKEISREAVPL